jgi:hypothetical protein
MYGEKTNRLKIFALEFQDNDKCNRKNLGRLKIRDPYAGKAENPMLRLNTIRFGDMGECAVIPFKALATIVRERKNLLSLFFVVC